MGIRLCVVPFPWVGLCVVPFSWVGLRVTLFPWIRLCVVLGVGIDFASSRRYGCECLIGLVYTLTITLPLNLIHSPRVPRHIGVVFPCWCHFQVSGITFRHVVGEFTVPHCCCCPFIIVGAFAT